MRPDESFVRQPIRSLQTMLRTIAADDDRQLNVIPDGVYTRQTADAVSSFQRRNGLPATGVADQRTWDAITDDFRTARTRQQKAAPIQIHLKADDTFQVNDTAHQIALAQLMLRYVFEEQTDIPIPSVNGRLDRATVEAIIEFQTLSALEPTGELDKITWKHLALQFTRAGNILNRNRTGG